MNDRNPLDVWDEYDNGKGPGRYGLGEVRLMAEALAVRLRLLEDAARRVVESWWEERPQQLDKDLHALRDALCECE